AGSGVVAGHPEFIRAPGRDRATQFTTSHTRRTLRPPDHDEFYQLDAAGNQQRWNRRHASIQRYAGDECAAILSEPGALNIFECATDPCETQALSVQWVSAAR